MAVKIPTLVAIVLLFVCLGPPARAEDSWLGPDKALHFSVSVGLSAGGYALGSAFLDERWERALFGAGLSLGLGIAKEAYDATGAGDPSFKDLAWDVIGTATGTLLAYALDLWLCGGESDAPPPESAALLRLQW